MKFTESQLKNFAAPVSESEKTKCKNAIGMVRDAMKLIGYSDENKEILNKKFNGVGVERKDKSIKVQGNSYRVDSDVVPSYRFRNYTNDHDVNPNNYIGGIEIRPDNGGNIRNYPEQHIINGKRKNNITNHSFKKQVRIAKKIKQNMIDLSYKSVENVSSFGVESLLWNIPELN